MVKRVIDQYSVDIRTSSSRAYLYNFNGYLYQALSRYLQKYSISVIEGERELRQGGFKYIFHKNSIQKITKTLYEASRNNSIFILLLTKENSRSLKNIISMLSTIRADVEIYLFHYQEPEDEKQAQKIVKEIFEDIFINKRHRVVSYKTQTKKLNLARNELPRKSKQNIRQLSPVLKLSITLLVLFLIPTIYILTIVSTFYLGVKKLDFVQNSILKGNISRAKKESDQALIFFIIGEKVYNISNPVISIFSSNNSKAIQNSFKLSQLLAKTLSQAAYTTQVAQTVGESIMSSRTSLHQSQLATFQSEIKTLDEKVQNLVAQVKSVENTNSVLYRLFDVNQKLKKSEATLKDLSSLLSLASRMAQVLPEVLGYDKPKTFLLIFQNNSELRPTGGFIGSFGWVTFSQGRLLEFKTEDVYTADGQLKGHVEPPLPIKKYLSQENWYLRDSNFAPDFYESATQAEWFLKHEMNLEFDGVFAFDLNAVAQVLRGVGGVYVSDYSEEVTADNLFLKTQTASETGFFPGSTQKRDFIGSLTRSLFIKLTSDRISWPLLIHGIKNSLDEKHALLYFHNESAQKLVEEAGWAGRIASVSCTSQNCIPDYLMLVEANLGINKANFLVSRTASLTITRGQQFLSHEFTVNFVNQSDDYVYPGGTYFSYTRVLLPKNASLSKISFGGAEIKKEEITIEDYQDKLSVGFPIRISGKDSKQLLVSYSIPSSPSAQTIELLVQKQPGVSTYPLSITVNADKNITQSIGGVKSYTQIQEISSDHLISLE